MPCNYRDYPENWKEIRATILERARHRCEFCGVPNRTWINRYGTSGDRVQGYVEYMGENAEEASLSDLWNHAAYWGRVFVVLTIAHLDHDTTNNDHRNLRALCQRCHLSYDAKHHAANARETVRARYGQQELFRGALHAT